MTDRYSSNINFHEFDWSEKEKSSILSSFFWGYSLVQIPAGQLGQYFSPKFVLVITNFIAAIFAALTPLAAYYGGWQLLCAIRVGQGLCQGFYVPLAFNIISKWVPSNEENRFVGFICSGVPLGAACALPLSGLLAESSGGWPSIFYVSGCLGIIWSILMAWLGADSPSTHSTITSFEKQYIESFAVKDSINKILKLKTPWKSILTSLPYYSLLLVHLVSGLTYFFLVTEMPSYINSILKFDVRSNGFMSSIPYFSLWIFTFIVSWLADFLQAKGIISKNVERKLWTTFCTSGSGIALIIISFAGYNAVAVIATFTIAVSCHAFLFSGFLMNHMDLAPNFTGVLVGIGNSAETVSAILAPLAVGLIVHNPKSVEEWRIVLIIIAGLNAFGNIIYVIFGSVKIQSWNTPVE